MINTQSLFTGTHLSKHIEQVERICAVLTYLHTRDWPVRIDTTDYALFYTNVPVAGNRGMLSSILNRILLQGTQERQHKRQGLKPRIRARSKVALFKPLTAMGAMHAFIVVSVVHMVSCTETKVLLKECNVLSAEIQECIDEHVQC